MRVFPAIDILQGQAVRLLRGDYGQVTVYNPDVMDQARRFVEQGARWLHMVDLDGARDGHPVNREVIAQVARQFPELRIQVGGGIRTIETAQRLVDAGVTRVILGTALIGDGSLIDEMVRTLGSERIVAGIDARDGMVAVEGWRQGTSVKADELAVEMGNRGIRHLVFTDIARDGAQTGIDAHAYRALARHAGFPVIVSGGVTTLDDLVAVRALGDAVAEGVIIGRALYEQNFALDDAIGVVEDSTKDKTRDSTEDRIKDRAEHSTKDGDSNEL